MAALSAMKMKMLSRSTPSLSRSLFPLMHRSYSSKFSKSLDAESLSDIDNNDVVPTSGISRPLSEILKQLNKKVPDSLLKQRFQDDFSFKYIPWHIVNRIMNLHAPEWSGEVRSITYSADGKTVSVVYRVTIYGTDAEFIVNIILCRSIINLKDFHPHFEIYRESTGTAFVNDVSYGDPVQKAEAMAFRRACARFGLGLHLYHEDSL